MIKTINDDKQYAIKCILIGDSSVGKSSILLRFLQNKFYEYNDFTTGIEFSSYEHKINDKKIKLYIWDTAGQECYKSITRAYYRSSLLAMLVFDLTDRKSFEHIKQWLEDVKTYSSPVRLYLIGNKSDLKDKRQITRYEAGKFAEDNNMSYYETSAKEITSVQTNNSIQNLFFGSINDIYDDICAKKITFEINGCTKVKLDGSKVKNKIGSQYAEKYCCFF